MSDVIRKNIDFYKPNIDWLEKHYGKKSCWHIMNLLLEKFKEAHDIHPEEQCKVAANKVKEILDGGLSRIEE